MTNGGSSVVVGGGSGAGSGDGITMAWVDANYVSKEFFSRLFKAYDSESTPNEVLPNDLESTITNIKMMFGTWTEQYLSSLGQSAGGSSGASALVDLTDVAISSPTDGQVLTYDANLGKWVNRAAGGGGSGISMSDVWDAMGGSTSEQINKSHLTDALANYVTSSDISDMATETWCNNRFLTSETYTGTVTSVRVRATSPVQSSVSTAQTASLDTTISLSDGYGDSKNPYGSKTKNYVLASPAGANGMPSFRALVAADIPDLSGTYLTSAAISDMATKTWVNSQNFLKSITYSMVTNALGYTPVNSSTTWWGQSISNGSVSGNISNARNITMSGYIFMDNNTSLQMKDNNGNQTILLTLNTGNTFALGYGPRTSGYTTDIQGKDIIFVVSQSSRLEAMSISNTGNVYIRQGAQGLRIGDGLITWDSDNNALKVTKHDGTAINMYSLGGLSALGAWTGSNGDITVTGVTATGNIQGADLVATTKVTSPKFYFDSSRYLYLDGTTLKFNNNGTIKTVVLS